MLIALLGKCRQKAPACLLERELRDATAGQKGKMLTQISASISHRIRSYETEFQLDKEPWQEAEKGWLVINGEEEDPLKHTKLPELGILFVPLRVISWTVFSFSAACWNNFVVFQK